MRNSNILVSILFFTALLFASGPAYSQSADNASRIIPKTEDDNTDQPKSFRETLVKLRIDKEKKDFAEMIERGEEALRLTKEVEKAYASTGRLDPMQLNKLNSVEKLVKKIRSDLGGGDDDDKDLPYSSAPEKGEVVKTFKSTTKDLLEELRKTTRFTVSAAAIQASNAVLKIARLLKLSK